MVLWTDERSDKVSIIDGVSVRVSIRNRVDIQNGLVLVIGSGIGLGLMF